jgi:hypothetical protein
MGLQNVRILILVVAATTVLSACSSFTLSAPTDGAIVKLPAKTTVVVNPSPSMSGLVVKLDGTNVSNQINYVSDRESLGDLSVSEGNHTITAEADVPCWYCAGQTYHPSSQTKFCVAAATWPSTATTFTAFAKGDNMSWAKTTSDTTVGVAADTGTATTRWNLVRVGGIGQAIGIIQSTENTCLCMRSTAIQSGTPIGLAMCDSNDSMQLWQALWIPNTNDHYRLQNVGRSVSSACLTEGANSMLIQDGCLDTDQQLWQIKDNKLGIFVSPF